MIGLWQEEGSRLAAPAARWQVSGLRQFSFRCALSILQDVRFFLLKNHEECRCFGVHLKENCFSGIGEGWKKAEEGEDRSLRVDFRL